MAMIIIPLTFDKSHLTKDEKEMSPPCSATSLRNLWRIWLLGCPWMSFTYTSEDKKRDTNLITFSGTFSVSIPFFSFWWPSLQSVFLKDLVPKGRYQPFKRVPGNKYRNDHTLGCPALTGTFKMLALSWFFCCQILKIKSTNNKHIASIGLLLHDLPRRPIK